MLCIVWLPLYSLSFINIRHIHCHPQDPNMLPPPPLQRKSKPIFVNFYGAQESIPPGWESIPGLHKRFTKAGSALNSRRLSHNFCNLLRQLAFPLASTFLYEYTIRTQQMCHSMILGGKGRVIRFFQSHSKLLTTKCH
jgi:hypothetical protein